MEMEPTKNVPKCESVVKVSSKARRNAATIPDHILHNAALNEFVRVLPANYNFEIYKSVWKILSDKVETVALQFPEGLLMYACIISDIVTRFTGAKVIILGDVTYGACCIDDYTAHKLGATLLIHYGHSCLVPVSVTRIKVLYVFVEIQFDAAHLVATVAKNFAPTCRLALLGTIQFTGVVHAAAAELRPQFAHLTIPQVKPLSPGEPSALCCDASC